MFCASCGTQMPDNVKFCSSCGDSLSGSNYDIRFGTENNSEIKIVPAKCTGCGASLKVNANEKAAICPYCNNAYIVEQAINNYNINMVGNVSVGSATINVSGANVDNLLLRAKDFEIKGNFKNALNYYNQVLDIDFSVAAAQDGIKRIKNIIINHVYFQTNARASFSSGVLQLKKERLVYLTKKGKETVYHLRKITKLSKDLVSIQFYHDNRQIIMSLPFNTNKEWIDIINSAKVGIYPSVES